MRIDGILALCFASCDDAKFRNFQKVLTDCGRLGVVLPNSPPLFATTIWANPLRTTPETLADILAADNVPFEPGDAKLYLVNHDHQPPASPQPNASGILLFMRTRVRNPKLTTVATSLLGHTAARN